MDGSFLRITVADEGYAKAKNIPLEYVVSKKSRRYVNYASQ